MNWIKITALILAVSFTVVAQKQNVKGSSPAGTSVDEITADELAAHLRFLASDLLQGRKAGTQGEQLAAQYLAAQYKAMGISALKNEPVHRSNAIFNILISMKITHHLEAKMSLHSSKDLILH